MVRSTLPLARSLTPAPIGSAASSRSSRN